MDLKLNIFYVLIHLIILVFFGGEVCGHDIPLAKRNSTGLTTTVTWDPLSLSLFSQRVFVLSAEFHPWRLPNPNLWSDVFQKIKANGFNTVSFYVNWAIHFPSPSTNNGDGDFQSGTYRDIQMFIDEAKNAGLWLIARPGPYINGETTGGGFPGWVGNIAGSLRTDNANYTAAWTPYMTAIAKIIAKNQISNGGPVILIQAENEYSAGTNNSPYMQAIIDLYRANGIVIPISYNDQHAGLDGNFSPDLPGVGRVNIYCGDSYPQSGSSWAEVQTVYHSLHEQNAPSNPLCLAEFGGGYIVSPGSVAMGGTGYEKYSDGTAGLTNADYENVFYKDAYSQGATIFNVYMLFGGTNWGQTAEPTVYTSYDYGGGINENRVAGPKMNEMRLQGLFLRVSRDFPGSALIGNGTNYTTNSAVHTAELRNLQTGAGFYVLRQNLSTSTSLVTTQLNVSTSVGSMTVPVNGSITLNGRDSKILITDYKFGQKETTVILYSTAEIMTWSTIDTTDYIILYLPTGQAGETSFLFNTAPRVSLINSPNVASNYVDGLLTLNYDTTISGVQTTWIASGTKSIAVLIMDKPTANTWSAPIVPGDGAFGNYFSIGSNQSVLVSGPYLVRSADILGNTLKLTGDLNGTTPIEFIAPEAVSSLSWNGQHIAVSKTVRQTYSGILIGAKVATLPALTEWLASGSLPEIDPSFDDSSWVTADLTSTNYTNLPPLSGQYVLYSQQYGFYGGNLVWRGHFNASGEETALNLTVQGGFYFGYSAWLNGIFLGSNQGSSTASMTTDTWAIPTGTLLVGKDNVLTVVQGKFHTLRFRPFWTHPNELLILDHMGIVESSTNSGKEPRGIRGYSITGGNTTFSRWKLQGNQGGAAKAVDTFRGYLNEGGLYGERIGAHLPLFPDWTWKSTKNISVSTAGINFFRTTFNLNLNPATDVPIRLAITPSSSSSNFRAQIYINGWQVGKYVNNIGPQTIFVLPAGILRGHSINYIAISLWCLDASGASIAGLSLIQDGTFASALHVKDYVSAPDYSPAGRQGPVFQSPM